MLQHEPYPKIATRLTPDSPLVAGTWVATEKIHGAQLQVATDGTSVRIGKRKAWLADDEPFFGWQLLRAELEAHVRRLHAALGGKGVVRLFGEIFGGAYPHPDVAPCPGASPVQTGIWYSPDVRFAAFDLLLQAGSEAPEGEFLSQRELEDLAGDELLAVPVIGRGKRGDLECLPTRYPSRVAISLGLPEIVGNVAEGLVLKPDQRLPPSRRPIVKHKIPEFDESRFDEAAPFNSDARLSLAELRTLADRLVNPIRLASARSKVGAANDQALWDEVALDVLIDLQAAFPRAMRELPPEGEDELRALIDRVARERGGA